jgi:hypothetical protein
MSDNEDRQLGRALREAMVSDNESSGVSKVVRWIIIFGVILGIISCVAWMAGG